MSRESLGHFELLVLLALLRQGDEAYGVPIANAIEQSTGKPVILASVYNTLERLEQKGLVRSVKGQPTLSLHPLRSLAPAGLLREAPCESAPKRDPSQYCRNQLK